MESGDNENYFANNQSIAIIFSRQKIVRENNIDKYQLKGIKLKMKCLRARITELNGLPKLEFETDEDKRYFITRLFRF